jgi:hypothetical protein
MSFNTVAYKETYASTMGERKPRPVVYKKDRFSTGSFGDIAVFASADKGNVERSRDRSRKILKDSGEFNLISEIDKAKKSLDDYESIPEENRVEEGMAYYHETHDDMFDYLQKLNLTTDKRLAAENYFNLQFGKEMVLETGDDVGRQLYKKFIIEARKAEQVPFVDFNYLKVQLPETPFLALESIDDELYVPTNVVASAIGVKSWQEARGDAQSDKKLTAVANQEFYDRDEVDVMIVLIIPNPESENGYDMAAFNKQDGTHRIVAAMQEGHDAVPVKRIEFYLAEEF